MFPLFQELQLERPTQRIVSREKKDIAKGEDLTLASFQATETGSLLR